MSLEKAGRIYSIASLKITQRQIGFILLFKRKLVEQNFFIS